MQKKTKVYVAGKLNADAVGYIKNMHKMIFEADLVRRAGFSVFVPCLDFLMGLQNGFYEYEDYFDNSQPFLEVCDCMFVCDNWENSEGTKREMELAKELNIPVYFNLDQLIKTHQ